jgi:hypothetical protein
VSIAATLFAAARRPPDAPPPHDADDGGGRGDEQECRADRHQAPAARGGSRTAGAAGERRIVVEDLLLEPPQLRPPLEPELVVQPPAAGAIGGERVGLASGSVQREHQLAEEPLPVRVLGDQRLQLADQLALAAKGQIGVDPVLERRQARLLQPCDLAPRERLVRQVGERLTPP